MKCRKCGNEIEENAKFCPYCGTKINKDTNEEADGKNRKFDNGHKLPNQIIHERSTWNENQNSPERQKNILTTLKVYEESKKQNTRNDRSKIEEIRSLVLSHKLISIGIAILIVVMIILIIAACIPRPESISATFNGVAVDGEVWDDTNDNIIVNAHYSDGHDEKVTDWTMEKAAPVKLGERTTGVVKYKGREAKFTIDGSSVSDGDGYFQMYPRTIIELYEQELSRRYEKYLSKQMNKKFHISKSSAGLKLNDNFQVKLYFDNYRMDENGKRISPKKDEIPKSVTMIVYGDPAKASDEEVSEAKLATETFAYIVQSQDSFDDVEDEYNSILDDAQDQMLDDDYEDSGDHIWTTADGNIGEISSRVGIAMGDNDFTAWTLIMDEEE